MEPKGPQSELEHIFDYKEYSVFQDMENGYYIAFDQDDKIICNEATIKMVIDNIDNALDEGSKTT